MPDARRSLPGLRAVLRIRDFRRLLVVRLVGQTADGLLQVGLASFVFFSPERAATPARVALGFALLLLPFSVVGPFAGVLLDRWSRRQVLVVTNSARAVGVAVVAALVLAGQASALLYLLALTLLGLNRFVLAALGASLPHVVPSAHLVTANAVAPTAGTAMSFVGAGLGVALSMSLGAGDRGDAAAVGLAALTCLVAATAALLLPRDRLGPDEPVAIGLATAAADVGRGAAEGLVHLRHRPPAARSLTVMGGHRFLFAAVTVMGIVLYRNSFYPGDPNAALSALGLSLAVGGGGAVLGAVLTPGATRRIGSTRWMTGLLLMAAVGLAVALPTFALPGYLVAAFVIGVTAQGLKVSVDAILQTWVEDGYRGRVFTIYDVVFNVSFVLAAILTALLIPLDGRSPGLVAAVSIGYLALSWWYWRTSRSLPDPAAATLR